MKKPVENKNYAENLVKMQLAEAAKAPGEMDADFVLECAEAALELQGIDYELSAEEIKAKVAAIPFKTVDGEKPQKRVRSMGTRRVMAIAAALAGLLMISCIYAIAEGETAQQKRHSDFEKKCEEAEEKLKDINPDIQGQDLSREEVSERLAEYGRKVAAVEKEVFMTSEYESEDDRQFVENGGILVVYDTEIAYTPSYAKFYSSLEETVEAENLDIIYPKEFPQYITLYDLRAYTSGVTVQWFNPFATSLFYVMQVEYSQSIPEEIRSNYGVIEIAGITCYEQTEGLQKFIAFEYGGNGYYISGQKLEAIESLVESMLNGVTEQN